MKIVICTPGLYISGGTEKVITDKANYLSIVFGYEVIILCYQGKEKFFKLDPKVKVKNLSINYDEINNEESFILKKFKFYFKLNRHKKIFKKFLQKEKPDIITAWDNLSSYICLNSKTKCKKILECHVDKSNFLGKERDKFLFRILDKYRKRKRELNILKWDKFIVLTEEGKEEWIRERNINNIKIIPNSLPFYPDEISSCKNKTIISVGRLVEQKGYNDLIEVWNKLFQKYPDWKLEIYGEGPLKKELQEKIDTLGMTSSLLLKGVDKNIMDKYLKSSIYVMSSRYEGFGMVLVEAMACGLPVISFDCPCGPKDIIKDGEDGFLIRNRDLNEMANKLEFLIQNEEKRKNMGKKAHQNIARYSKDKVMLQWKNLFEELVDKKER